MARASVIAAVALLSCALLPPVAAAQVQRTDPDASSPAGVIYEIPFDHARQDSAPVGPTRGGGGNGQGGQGTTGTSGSDNGAQSTGNTGDDQSGSGDAGAGSGAGAGDDSAAAKNPNVGTSIHSENGFGSSSQVPGVGTVALTQEDALRQSGGAGGNTSTATFGLIALVLVVGSWVGIVAGRALRS